MNFLLPHLQRVHNNIQRDELAANMSQKLGIDSALLRQEMKHAVNTRAASIKTPAEPQVNEAEKIVVRVLSSREERELSAKIHDIFSAELLHQGLTCESLINALLASNSPDEPMNLELNDGDRRLLASILMNETQEELSSQLAEQALHALRRQRMERQQRTLKAQIAEAERKQDSATLARLMQEKLALDRTLSERK